MNINYYYYVVEESPVGNTEKEKYFHSLRELKEWFPTDSHFHMIYIYKVQNGKYKEVYRRCFSRVEINSIKL